MDIRDFLQSGIIESFCLGTSTTEERLLVKTMKDLYPEVNKEIARINATITTNKTSLPLSKVKTTLMRTVYRTEALKTSILFL